ncbi:hypothetical protein QBC34DRAFT_83310 [Podospora aff. communis PSN243]|uniref:Archaemetzincin-2 n=1 Tax=Podospora aff. communis PSN243 TaxID=3040156 RepID=A0AAV9GP43_9PEZI|nr:hypothetical protein QBC34DRAFT_83310 [Podospora aff. communis PSN243]
MPPSKQQTKPQGPCAHTEGLQTDVSDHAQEAGFTRPNLTARKAAATPSGRLGQFRGITSDPEEEALFAHTFPGPLILPDDALSIDRKDPPQSLRSWTVEKARNPFTEQRKTLYVAPVPTIPANLSFMKSWARPVLSPSAARGVQPLRPTRMEDIVSYLKAFYHPLPVKVYPGTVAFTEWEDSASKKKKKDSSPPDIVGLQVGEEGITGVRTRYCPDGSFGRQLNLNDILDAALEALPGDAYALVMMMDQDLYEDEEDDFCCGRAYGSSRIAVVSSARYHPDLDEGVVDREHMWPASHCVKYVREVVGEGMWADGAPWRRMPKQAPRYEDTPLAVAVKEAAKAPAPEEDLYGLWFSRLARTVAHELGHCLCLGHCSYYACVMQSTAGMGEDVRQPPYLCPVCLAKVTKGLMAVTPGVEEKEFQLQRYRALQKFCEGWMSVGMFAGYHAWLGKRIQSLGNTA